MKKISPPDFDKLSDYYKSYWKLMKEDDLMEAIVLQSKSSIAFLNLIPASTEDFSYAEGKWMLKEIIGHLCDTERILTYRALRFSRNDKTELPGFDENVFVDLSNFRSRSLKDIMDEWVTVRAATISFYKSITDEMADREGSANRMKVTARIILYFILVHERHHLEVIRERYLTTAFSS